MSKWKPAGLGKFPTTKPPESGNLFASCHEAELTHTTELIPCRVLLTAVAFPREMQRPFCSPSRCCLPKNVEVQQLPPGVTTKEKNSSPKRTKERKPPQNFGGVASKQKHPGPLASRTTPCQALQRLYKREGPGDEKDARMWKLQKAPGVVSINNKMQSPS